MSDISATPSFALSANVPLSERTAVSPKLLAPENAAAVGQPGAPLGTGVQATVPDATRLVGLTLYRDAASGLHVAIYTDKTTGEVREQIPEEKVLRQAARERQLLETTLDSRLALKA